MGGPRVGPEPPERGCPVDRWGSTALVLVLESFKIALNPDGTEGQVINLVLSSQKCVNLPVILLKTEGPVSHCLDRFQKPYRPPVVIFTILLVAGGARFHVGGETGFREGKRT